MAHCKEIKIPENAPRKVGVVESARRDKSRRISIQFSVKHPKYGKYIRRRTVVHAHDEGNISSEGDRVEIAECRPISKTKSWVVTRVISGSPEGEAQ